jgi:hypothetical protein
MPNRVLGHGSQEEGRETDSVPRAVGFRIWVSSRSAADFLCDLGQGTWSL